MQELEKILEEIQKAFEENTEDIMGEDGEHHFVIDGCTVMFLAQDIIRKHMNDGERFEFDFTNVKSFDCQCGRHYVNTGSENNDGWIPVEDWLPDNNEDVLVTTDVGLITFGYASHGKWITDQEPDYPIAWRPLPEPYKPKQPETCKYTGGSCCWPIDQCSDCPNNPERSENDQ